QRPLAADLALAVAFLARVEHQAAGAAAARAGPLDGEEALGGAHPARAAAGAAARRAGPGLGARAGAGLAAHGRGDGDLHVGAGVGLLQRDLEVVAQVLAARRT